MIGIIRGEIQKIRRPIYLLLLSVAVIAPTVLLPGDPLRAQWIAENFFEDPVQHNTIRNPADAATITKSAPRPLVIFRTASSNSPVRGSNDSSAPKPRDRSRRTAIVSVVTIRVPVRLAIMEKINPTGP